MTEWNMWKNSFNKVYASFEEEVSRYVIDFVIRTLLYLMLNVLVYIKYITV